MIVANELLGSHTPDRAVRRAHLNTVTLPNQWSSLNGRVCGGGSDVLCVHHFSGTAVISASHKAFLLSGSEWLAAPLPRSNQCRPPWIRGLSYSQPELNRASLLSLQSEGSQVCRRLVHVLMIPSLTPRKPFNSLLPVCSTRHLQYLISTSSS